jgi:hypothetical protein
MCLRSAEAWCHCIKIGVKLLFKIARLVCHKLFDCAVADGLHSLFLKKFIYLQIYV